MNFHAKPSYDANMHGIRKNWMYWLFFANISLPKVVETIRYDTMKPWNGTVPIDKILSAKNARAAMGLNGFIFQKNNEN